MISSLFSSLFRSVLGGGASLVSVVLVLFVALRTGFILGFSILYLLYCIYSFFFLMNGKVPTIKKKSAPCYLKRGGSNLLALFSFSWTRRGNIALLDLQVIGKVVNRRAAMIEGKNKRSLSRMCVDGT
jgi:hypothetical protein